MRNFQRLGLVAIFAFVLSCAASNPKTTTDRETATTTTNPDGSKTTTVTDKEETETETKSKKNNAQKIVTSMLGLISVILIGLAH